MTPSVLRRLALALPGAHEQPHFEKTSFRIGIKIFATMPADQAAVHLFVTEQGARAAVAEAPGHVELLWWGTRLSGVRVPLEADTDLLDGDHGIETALSEVDALLTELVIEAWRHRASRALLSQFDQERG